MTPVKSEESIVWFESSCKVFVWHCHKLHVALLPLACYLWKKRRRRTMASATSAALLSTLSASTDLPTSVSPSISIYAVSYSTKPIRLHLRSNQKNLPHATTFNAQKWRTRVSFFPGFLTKGKDAETIKSELLEAIEPLDRGAEATPEDQERIDQIARKLEAINLIKDPLKSNLLNGKWELIYTTSRSILQIQRPKFLRPNGKIYQAINVDTLRAQNMETWPFFNQVTANLVPLNTKRVAVKFDTFKIGGLIPIKASGRARGQLEITYLDKELRISRGDKGNLFILTMADPSYRVPV